MKPKNPLGFSSPILHYVFLLILTYGLYYQTFYNEWTLDDLKVLVNNPDIKSLSGFFENTKPGRPLRELSFWADYTFFGQSPFGYHFQHLFWHWLNGILIYLLGRKLFSRALPALLGAVLFLVHPLTVEVVANISHRKESLSLAFSLLSLLVFGWAHRSEKSKRLILFLGCFLLYLVACTAKQNAFLVPLLWLAYEYRFVASGKRVLAITSPGNSLIILFCAGCCAYLWKLITMGGVGALQLHAWKAISRMDLYPKPDFIDYVHLLLKSWGTMLAKIVWPVNLAPEYSIQAPATWHEFLVILAILTSASVLIALYRSRRQHESNVFFALLWCLTFWLPVSNLWPAAALAADRYWYAILPGLIYLFLQAIRPLFESHRKITAAIIVCLCLVFAAISFQQSQHWCTNALLWQRAVTVSPQSSVANHNMGVTLYLNGEVEPALEYLRKSVSLYPYKKIGFYNLSQIYTRLGRHSEALDAKHKMRLQPPWERH